MLVLRIYGYALAFSFCFITLMAASPRTHPSEVKALLDIKKSLVDPMDKLRNWNKRDPCTTANWTGVWCFDKKGDDGYFHIRELYLMTSNLSGTLAPQLGLLSHLVIMDFMWNNLTGTIPKEIGNIKSLRLLLLNGNQLSGSLPDELGNLSNIGRLQLDENRLSGPVPESFANLVNVRHLHMNNNSFNGQIPPALSNLSNLMHLLLDNNNLSGYLPPEFSKLQSLEILQLDNNNFSGNGIPSSYETFRRLVKLSLRNCSLQGPIPNLSSIRNLTYLDLSWNQFSGPIPLHKLADHMTTVDLSHNKLNGTIPRDVIYPHLQRLQLENNLLTGSFPTTIWQNISFSRKAKLIIDIGNNLLSDIFGDLNPPENVTLRLFGNPVCKNSNIQRIGQFCVLEGRDLDEEYANSTICPAQSCPLDNFYEFAPSSPIHCFCAAPIRIGYRLKSPSFSYFPPYKASFVSYITDALNLSFYQLSIDSYEWEEGPRLRMYLKIFPSYNDSHSNTFSPDEVRRINIIYSSWRFPHTDFFGPYELLNVTLLGPYANIIINTEGGGKRKTGILVAIILAAVACVLAISAIIMLLIFRRKVKYQHLISRKRMSSNVCIKIDGVKAFTLKELTHATNKFDISSKVGEGGYGIVYKGILSDETFVAVKRAGENSLQGQKEFLTEIELLSRLHHRNLVSLTGYCNEEGEQMLVYEFMPNGTLREWISGKSKKCKEGLSFFMRLRIAMGASKGILYLHTEANPPIYHRDIKASNILLDSKFTAKVADFGLSRLIPYSDEDGHVPNYVSTVVKGTPGYLDPEYMMTHKLTDKSDVYSLGIVFLELLTGMHPISRGKNIVREVNLACQSGTIDSIIDNRMGEYPPECLDKFLALALSCCEDHPEERPSMIDVVRELEDIIALLPETEISLSDVSLDNSGKMVPSSSASSSATTSGFITTRKDQQHMSSFVSGSDLVSDVIPTIVPR